MHTVEGHVEEERFGVGHGFVLCDQSGGFRGDEFGAVTVFAEWFVVAIPVDLSITLVIIIVNCTEVVPILVIEAASGRSIGWLEFTKVPFAGDGGAVASLTECVGECAFIERQAPAGVGTHDGVDAGMSGVASGHECRAGG